MGAMRQTPRIVSAVAVAGVVICGLFAIAGDTKGDKKEEKTVLEQNKNTVTAFYKLAFNDHKPADAVLKYVGNTYKQHNPTVGDGPKAFIEFVEGFAKANPGLRADIKRIIAEGDLVVVHVHMKMSDEDRGLAVIDIFRLEDGKIVEHWDAMQPVPEKSANDNTMF